jgi:hypothetical protein
MVRFDKPCVQVSHAVNYFSVHMAKQDYLSQGGEAILNELAVKVGLPVLDWRNHADPLHLNVKAFLVKLNS